MLDVHTDMDRRTRQGQKDVTLLDANEFKDTLKLMIWQTGPFCPDSIAATQSSAQSFVCSPRAFYA